MVSSYVFNYHDGVKKVIMASKGNILGNKVDTRENFIENVYEMRLSLNGSLAKAN